MRLKASETIITGPEYCCQKWLSFILLLDCWACLILSLYYQYVKH